MNRWDLMTHEDQIIWTRLLKRHHYKLFGAFSSATDEVHWHDAYLCSCIERRKARDAEELLRMRVGKA